MSGKINHWNAFFIFVLSLFCVEQHVCAQCANSACLTDVISLNTGVDPTTGNLLANSTSTAAVQDGQWILINAPTNNGLVNLGAPAFVIATNPSWHDMPPVATPPSKYIAAFPRNTSNEANITGTPYIFQKIICVCDSHTVVTISDSIHVDNRVTLKLQGPGLGSGLVLSQYSNTVVSNFRNPPEDDGIVNGITLHPGTYYIEAEVRNDNSGSPMGLNITGTLKANKAALSDPTCCNHGAFISGYKFLDNNCDGIQNSTERYSAGWPIELYDASGTTLIANTTTDVSGYYFFAVTTPGTYVIKEPIPPTGWSQTFPSGPQTHTVTITGTEIISNLNFGNCCQDCFNFIQAPINFTVNCTSQDNIVTFNPSGLLPTDFYSIDINGNGQNEIINIPGNQPYTYTFPHYGVFNLKITVNRPACDEPCEKEITKTITVIQSACQESYCYDWEEITFLCNVNDMTFFKEQPVFSGDLVFGYAGITTWDGASWGGVGNWHSFFPNHAVHEVEPFLGDLMALAFHNNKQTVYRYNGVNWQVSHQIPINTNYTSSGFWDWNHEEMFHSPHGLFVAFNQNIGSNNSHVIKMFDGTTWISLPISSLTTVIPGTIFQYFQVGNDNGYPVIRVDYSQPSGIGSHLAAWDGVQWSLLTNSAFQQLMPSGTSIFDYGMGINTVEIVGDIIYVGGGFESIDGKANTKRIAQYNRITGQWSDVGGGVSASSPPAGLSFGILDIQAIGTDIFINGAGILELGGVSVQNTARFDGVKWHNLFPGLPEAIFMTSFVRKDSSGACEVHFAGECIYGKTTFCCSYENITLTDPESATKVYYTHGDITSSSTIVAPTADIVYKAGQNINLQPTFNVQTGATYLGLNVGCDDCCPDDPLNDLPFLAQYVGQPQYTITKCMYNGDCIYKITDFCLVSDGTTSYYDCLGNLFCEQFSIGGNCPVPFNLTACVVLQNCN